MSLHQQGRSTLDARVKAKEGPLTHHVAADGGDLLKKMGKTWSSIQVMAKGRQSCRDHVVTLQTTKA